MLKWLYDLPNKKVQVQVFHLVVYTVTMLAGGAVLGAAKLIASSYCN